MEFTDLSFSREPRVQLRVTNLEGGRLEVRGWNSAAIYERGEYMYDAVRDELHLPLSRGQDLIKQPFSH